MRRVLTLLTTILMIIGASALSVPSLQPLDNLSSPPSNGDSVTITGDETWTGPQNFDGSVLISGGANLTIEGHITITQGSSITVENGSLVMNESSSMISDSTEQSMRVMFQDGMINIPIEEYGNNTITFHFSADVSGYGPTFDNSQNQTFMAEGTSQSIYYNSNGENSTWIEIIHQPFGSTTIDQIIVEGPSGTQQPYSPAELESEGLYYCCEYQWSLAIASSGSASISSGAEISGAEITVAGAMQIDGALVDRSSPIVLNDGILTVANSTLSRSFDDEDIRATIGSTVEWENSNGTGGFVDRWTKLMGPQTIQTPVGGTNLLAVNLGWQGLSKSGISDEDGLWVLTIPERIVVLENSTGVLWSEDAHVEALYNSVWGNFSSNTSLNTDAEVAIVLDLPILQVDSVVVEKYELSVNSPLEVTATVSNAGQVGAVDVSLDCTLENGSDARLSPAYPQLSVAAGGSESATFTWRGSEEGEISLNCIIVAPIGWIGPIQASGGASSEVISWQGLVDAEDDSGIVIVILVAMGFGIVLAMVLAMRQYREQMDAESENEASDNIDAEDKDYEQVEEKLEDNY
jgi:hypothetical protein